MNQRYRILVQQFKRQAGNAAGLMAALVLGGCEPSHDPSPPPRVVVAPKPTSAFQDPLAMDPHVAQWAAPSAELAKRFAGRYVTTLPCADCTAIETVITLFADGRAVREQTQVGHTNSLKRQVTRWQAADYDKPMPVAPDKKAIEPVIKYVLDNQTFYFDQPNWGELRQLDLLAKPVTGLTAKSYVFTENPPRPAPDIRQLSMPLATATLDGQTPRSTEPLASVANSRTAQTQASAGVKGG